MQNWIVAFERLHERAVPRIGMQKRKRGAKVGKSGRRSGAQRYLPLVISARWTPISQHFPADPSFATRAMPFPESEAFRFPSSLTCLRSPLPGRRQPVMAASREAGAWLAAASTGWRWSGLLGFKQARLALRSQLQPSRPCKRPVNSAAWHGDAGDVLPDALIEHGLPRHQTEAEPTITTEALDHRESAAG
jgi:hypothetical protein